MFYWVILLGLVCEWALRWWRDFLSITKRMMFFWNYDGMSSVIRSPSGTLHVGLRRSFDDDDDYDDDELFLWYV